jgi:hypothetical protein
MAEAINGGEAADLRERMRTMENRQASFERQIEVKVSVHEQKCASRMLIIMILMTISIGVQMPAAWPRIMAMLGLA